MLTLAGNGDVFAAAGMIAIRAGRLGNRSRYFVGIDAPIGRSLGEIPRFAVGQGGVGAAFLALGEALVDPIPIRLIFDDENAAFRRRGGSGAKESAGKKR